MSAQLSEVGERAVDLANAIFRMRMQRELALGAELFSDPAWDMLLDLYIAKHKDIRLSVTALCLGARCSPATGIRYITALTKKGWVHSVDDAMDGRRRFIILSDEARDRMHVLLSNFDKR